MGNDHVTLQAVVELVPDEAHACNHRTHDISTLMSLLARFAEPLPLRTLTA